MSEVLGKKLTAYLASVKDGRAVDRWIAGTEPYKGCHQETEIIVR